MDAKLARSLSDLGKSQMGPLVELTTGQVCVSSSPQHSIAGPSPWQQAISQLAMHRDPADAMGIQPKLATKITNPVINRFEF